MKKWIRKWLSVKQYPFQHKTNKQIIFIHIPKTAGTSIVNALNLGTPDRRTGIRKHYNAREIIKILGETQWLASFRFSFVRNPWDRMLSHYRFRKKNQRLKLPIHYSDFDQFVADELFHLPRPTTKRFNLEPQVDWLVDLSGEINLNYIGRFERLNYDFTRICDLAKLPKMSLPHIEASGKKVDYHSYYSSNSKKLVSQFYASDIETFKYQF